MKLKKHFSQHKKISSGNKLHKTSWNARKAQNAKSFSLAKAANMTKQTELCNILHQNRSTRHANDTEKELKKMLQMRDKKKGFSSHSELQCKRWTRRRGNETAVADGEVKCRLPTRTLLEGWRERGSSGWKHCANVVNWLDKYLKSLLSFTHRTFLTIHQTKSELLRWKIAQNKRKASNHRHQQLS